MKALARFEISPETIAKTQCDKGFICLNGSPLYCSVISTLGHSMVQLECHQQLPCRHNKGYGALQICNCPVRHKIYTKYNR